MQEENTIAPDTIFESFDMDAQSFRKAGYAVVDAIADYYETVKERKIVSENSSSEIEAAFNDPLPEVGEDPESILQDFEARIIPNATHLGSPRYFGFVNGSGTMMSVFASAFASAVNMNSGGWKAGPAATEIERRSIKWIAEMIGYPTDCGGLFVGGGMVANFSALLTAFRDKVNYDATDEGLQSDKLKGKYVLYMSDHEGHISIVKSVDLINLGRNSIRRVPSNDDLSMNTAALEQMIMEDRASGLIPFCVVAQVGSINVGVVDPINEIANICEKNDLWFHADGACGAFGAMLEEKKHLYEGLDRADSVTLDPHKWLYISYECGCLLVRDAAKLKKTFSMSASYLQGTLPTDYKGLDYFDYGPQMSRGFNALKVWMTIRHYGRKGYEKLLRQNVQCAEHLDKLVRASDDFEALHKPELFIYSFRYFPAELRKQPVNQRLNSYLDTINQKIADEITASGFAFIMTSKVKGQVVIRLSICSHRTTFGDIEKVFDRLHEIGMQMYSEHPYTS